MTKDEALKLALEALESGVKTTANRISWTEYDCELMEQAITAIKEALAQPEHITEHFKRKPLIPASLAEQQFERYYRRGYDAGLAAQRKPLTKWQAQDIVELESWGPDAIALNYQLMRTIRRTEAAHDIKENT